MRFSANLGLLWPDHPLPDAIRAAKAAGFDAVECHWPYDEPQAQVCSALSETGLPMLGLNTVKGKAGKFGLSALPDQRAEARAAIEQALDYAAVIGAKSVHVMAGCAEGPEAEAAFREALRYACTAAAARDITVLVEPLNPVDVPGYFLRSNTQARALIEGLALPNLRLMFDCYHVAMRGEDVLAELEAHFQIIGHIQFADAPGRGAPGTGDLDFATVFQRIKDLGWQRPVGAEYRPDGPTEDSLGWLRGLP